MLNRVMTRVNSSRGRRNLASALVLLLAAIGLGGCAAVVPAPSVEHHTMKIPKGSLEKVAVLAFQPTASFMRAQTGQTESAESIADLVTRMMMDQMMQRGIDVIGSSDLQIAFSAAGLAPGHVDRRAAAQIASREFGATAILFGEVSRWRERQGESYGSTGAASVAFDMSLYTSPEMRRLWTSKFDETQRPLSEHVLNAQRYPGGGTRWLTATELAQWGIESAADTLPPRM